MKIAKFIKDHVAGFKTGDVRNLEDKLFNRLLENGFVKEGTEKELESHIKKLGKVKTSSEAYNNAKASANSKGDECEGCQDNVPKTDDVPEAKIHALNQIDIDTYPSESEGLKVGDVVLTNEEGALLCGDDDKFILYLGKDLAQ
jgi:tRNA U54 and U55 pseudouridine synthase Pus10